MLKEALIVSEDAPEQMTSTTVRDEIVSLLSNSWPVSISGLIWILFPMFCLIAVGHVEEKELAGTGFGMMFCNVTGYSVLLGLSSGLETVASQLFGAGQHRLVGIALQRSFLVSLIGLVPICIFWLLSGLYLPLFVEDSVALVASRYVHLFCIALLPCVAYESFRRYLDAQGLFHPPMYTTPVALLIYIPLCWHLVVTLRLGTEGVVLALCAGYSLCLAFLVAYVLHRRLHAATWGGWSTEAVQGIPEFLRVALPSCGMVCLEWWCFELSTLLSGRLGAAAVAAQSVMINVNVGGYMVGVGFSVAAGARVGNLLGAGRPAAARRAALLAWATCVCVMVLVCALEFAFRRQVAGCLPAAAVLERARRRKESRARACTHAFAHSAHAGVLAFVIG